jgi:tetratricopeptide (TPR) repeat protein
MGVLARIVAYRGDLTRAEQLYREAADLARRQGERLDVAINLYELGQVARLQRRLGVAEDRFQESLTLFHELDDVVGKAGALHALASVLAERGERAQAFKLLHEAADLLAGICYVSGLLDVLDSFAGLLSQVGEPVGAARLWGAFQALGEGIGHAAAHPLDAAAHRESIASVRVVLGEEAFDRAWAEGTAMTLDDALTYARSLVPISANP